MTSLLAEILGDKKATKQHSLEEVMVFDHVSLPELERLQHEITKLKLGQAAMVDEIARIRKELAHEKATKLAILSSWKYSMLRARDPKAFS